MIAYFKIIPFSMSYYLINFIASNIDSDNEKSNNKA